ncbi:MAG: ATP-dependent sacrificial sulfur transferase LarE [Eubacteriales bacterium]|nr:ATP-dependent sacrificial sulfur transferase LarE [Eubacteriales bacterium]
MTETKRMLQERLTEYCRKDLCVAFSGGVDSSLLLVMACEAAEKTGAKVYAITLDTVLHPKADLEIARTVLARTNAIHEVLAMDELAVPEIRFNPEDRCYLCKKELYSRMLKFASEKGAEVLLEGSNEDDLHVYRPGLRAVKELGVKSPLAECGITKAEVRAMAAEYGISVADRPSSPCLATRLPYGAEIDPELLGRIDRAELFIREMGFRNVRVRVHRDIVRLEIDTEQFPKVLEYRDKILSGLKRLGFCYITLDLEGFRSGSMDVGLN